MKDVLNFTNPDIQNHPSTCPRCGSGLFVYIGESKKEWDIEFHEWVESVPGQILPCPTCWTRQKILVGEAEKVQIMVRRCNLPKPEGMNESAWGHKLERWTKQAELARSQFEGVCQSWGFHSHQITERMFTLAQRRRDHATD